MFISNNEVQTGLDWISVFLIDMDTATTEAGFFQTEEGTHYDINVNEVIVGKCVADRFYIEQSSDIDVDNWDGTFPEEWGWNTIIDAKFNGNLAGGSIEFSADVVSAIRLKRRKQGDIKWKTIYVKDVNRVSDFQFDYYDRLAAGNTEYQYAFVPIIQGEEGPFSAQSVKSEFRDFYLFDRDQTYHVIMNAANTATYNIEGAAQTTIAKKYPFIIRNGYVSYYSGTFEATFVALIDCDWDIENSAHFRREVDKFLANDNAKILKDWMGNIYLVSIYEPIPQNNNEYVYTPIHTISWTECGDAEGIGDLYDNGFINTDIDRE